MEQTLTFDQLPLAVSLLAQKLENIERLLTERSEQVPTEQPDQLLTIEQTAEFLSLAVPTIYSMVSRKEIPFMKRRKRLYFSRAELTAYLKEGRHKTNAEQSALADDYLATKKPRQRAN
jgi:excisionase family DNA binding protein